MSLLWTTYWVVAVAVFTIGVAGATMGVVEDNRDVATVSLGLLAVAIVWPLLLVGVIIQTARMVADRQ